MTTFRPGTHHGVTIVSENDGARCGRPDHDCARGHLVAVVVAGADDLDAVEFAERICARLNGDGTPDQTYLRGAAEALAEVRRRLGAYPHPSEVLVVGQARRMLDEAATELGLDEDWQVGHGHEHQPGTPPHSHPRPANSCTCTVAGPDPACVVHQGRRARRPMPPNPPGCICDGSGRTCPRHGAVS